MRLTYQRIQTALTYFKRPQVGYSCPSDYLNMAKNLEYYNEFFEENSDVKVELSHGELVKSPDEPKRSTGEICYGAVYSFPTVQLEIPMLINVLR